MVEVQKKTIIAICLVAVGGGLLLYFVMSATNNINTVFTSSFEKPSLTDIRQMCYDKLVEMGYSQPTEMAVKMCTGTVVNGLAETRP